MNFRLCVYVNSPGGFVQNKDFGIYPHTSGNQHLLLVTSAEGTDRRVYTAGLNIMYLYSLFGLYILV